MILIWSVRRFYTDGAPFMSQPDWRLDSCHHSCLRFGWLRHVQRQCYEIFRLKAFDTASRLFDRWPQQCALPLAPLLRNRCPCRARPRDKPSVAQTEVPCDRELLPQDCTRRSDRRAYGVEVKSDERQSDWFVERPPASGHFRVTTLVQLSLGSRDRP